MKLLKIKITFGLLLGALIFYSCGSDDSTVTKKDNIIISIPDSSTVAPPNPNFGINTTETNASVVNTKMEAGFNLGNTFDLKSNSTSLVDIKPVIDKYISGGMKHMRIPVTWTDEFNGDHLTDDLGNVNFNHPRFLQLKEVIDYALTKKLYVIINAHHEREFKETYSNSTQQRTQFRNLWTDIATFFKNYPQHLIFEVLNEPEGAFGDFSGSQVSPFDTNAIELTRAINLLGYNAIRNSDPLNKNRIIMIAPNAQGNQSMIEEVFPSKDKLPGSGNDDFLMIQIHTYDPWPFCGQDGKNSEYPGKQNIENNVNNAIAHAESLNIPVNYGEFGVGRRVNQSERDNDIVREYYRTVVQTALSKGMSATPWDDRGWFGLVSQKNNQEYQFNFNIVPSMLEK